VTNLAYNNIEFGDNLFRNLNSSIIKSQQRISYIADGGINKGQAYQKAINKFGLELEKGLNENSLFSWHEILYITNELATSRHLFNTLLIFSCFVSSSSYTFWIISRFAVITTPRIVY